MRNHKPHRGLDEEGFLFLHKSSLWTDSRSSSGTLLAFQYACRSWLSVGQPRLQVSELHSKQKEGRAGGSSMKVPLVREPTLSQDPWRSCKTALSRHGRPDKWRIHNVYSLIISDQYTHGTITMIRTVTVSSFPSESFREAYCSF